MGISKKHYFFKNNFQVPSLGLFETVRQRPPKAVRPVPSVTLVNYQAQNKKVKVPSGPSWPRAKKGGGNLKKGMYIER
jgi:hypothetical protein